MKKVTLFGFVAAIAATSCFINYDAIANDSHESATALTLANLEALTSGESLTVNCYCKTRWFSSNVCSAAGDGSYCGGDPCPNHDGNCR